MPVYVDDMKASFGRMKMCHMIADSTKELLAMVDRIGVDRKWIQKADTPHEHFDICLAKRKLAVAAGAIEISQKELGIVLHSRRDVVACAAIDWKRTSDGMDYVPCDGTDAVPCRIEGILHTLHADLCRVHMGVFYGMGADVIPLRKPLWIAKANIFTRTNFVHQRPAQK